MEGFRDRNGDVIPGSQKIDDSSCQAFQRTIGAMDGKAEEALLRSAVRPFLGRGDITIEQQKALLMHANALYQRTADFDVGCRHTWEFPDGLQDDRAWTVFSDHGGKPLAVISEYFYGPGMYHSKAPLCILRTIQGVQRGERVDLEKVAAHLIQSWQELYNAQWKILLCVPGFPKPLPLYRSIRDRFFEGASTDGPYGPSNSQVMYHKINTNRRRVRELWEIREAQKPQDPVSEARL